MTENSPGEQAKTKEVENQSRFRALRVWPVLFLLLGMLLSFVPHSFNPDQPFFQMFRMLGPALCGILMLIWWAAISRARWTERLIGLAGVAVAFFIVASLLDVSMVGLPMILVTIPIGMAAFGLTAVLFRNRLALSRTVLILSAAAVGFAFSLLLRGSGVWGDGKLILDWRFSQSIEERLVAARGEGSSFTNENALEALNKDSMTAWLANPAWPAFRGGDRLAAVSDCVISTDWSSEKPKEVWSVNVGPGWSSFSVAGQLLFTQEQRGKMETVVCYSTETGEELWSQGIESRFEDSIGGPGPRATPTIAHGDLFVQGASGQLMRLDASTGDIKWQIDIRDVAKRDPPTWGYSASPLVVSQHVIVWGGGNDNLGTLAFSAEDGQLAWSVAAGNHSYSSPQLCEINSELFVAMLTNAGVDLIRAASGEVVLRYDWPEPGYRTLQPQIFDEDKMILPSATSVRMIQFEKADKEWSAKELWTSPMKPDFNDLVIYENHAYGFDGTIFCCIDLETGERAWKGGRYGKGQVLLLENKSTLLVLTEYGDLVLVDADPASHNELGRVDGIRGKTWNHPVLIGDRLYVRNSEEAACFVMPK